MRVLKYVHSLKRWIQLNEDVFGEGGCNEFGKIAALETKLAQE